MTENAAQPSMPVPYAHSRRWKLIANSAWNVVLLLVTLALITAIGAKAGPRLARLLLPDALALALPVAPICLLMASGELDLSLAGIAGLSGILAATLIGDNGGGLFAALGLCIGLGLGIGLGHAVLVGTGRMNGALVTFATGLFLGGIGLGMSSAGGIMARLGEAETALLNALGWGAALLALLAGIALNWLTPFGRRPLPGDPPEPRLRRTLMVGLPYAAAGALAGLAGVAIVARLQIATPGLTSTYEMRVMLAVVIGGTPFGRGVSNIAGALLGVFFTTALTIFLEISNVPAAQNIMLTGLVMVIALVAVHGYHALFARMVGRRGQGGGTTSESPALPVEKAGLETSDEKTE